MIERFCFSIIHFFICLLNDPVWNCYQIKRRHFSIVTHLKVTCRSFLLTKNSYCSLYVMLWTIWYHLHILKNVKNTHGEALLLVEVLALAYNFTKCNNPPSAFFTLFNFRNGTKSRKTSHIWNFYCSIHSGEFGRYNMKVKTLV